MSNYNISVVVPVYNGEKYIATCIEALLTQTFTEFELLLIDDGSTDNSGNICDKYVKKDLRVKVIHQKNQGLSAARNTGIDIAKGEFITFIDSDDYVHNQFLEKLYEGIVKYDADISVCKYKIFNEGEFPKQQEKFGQVKVLNNLEACSEIVKKNKTYMIIACGKLYKLKLFKNIRYKFGKHHEDEFTTYKLLYTSKYVAIINAQLYYYLQHDNSLMSAKYNLKRLDKLEALLIAVEYFKDHHEKKLKAQAQYRYLLNVQIAAYKILYESNYIEKYDELQTIYQTYYKSLDNHRNYSILNRIILNIFYKIPRISLMFIRNLTVVVRLFRSFIR